MKVRSFGFSGTSRGMGMTDAQAEAVEGFLRHEMPCVLHLGDCINADAQAYHIATRLGVYTVGHPPDQCRLRAYLLYDEAWPPKPYLERNDDIAREGVDGLIATPWEDDMPKNPRGHGTWYTIRKAQGLGRRLLVILPDGSWWEG